MRVVRAHGNYFTDTVLPMWGELFDCGAMLNGNLHTVGILDDERPLCTRNSFSAELKQCLYVSAGRARIALTTTLHMPAGGL